MRCARAAPGIARRVIVARACRGGASRALSAGRASSDRRARALHDALAREPDPGPHDCARPRSRAGPERGGAGPQLLGVQPRDRSRSRPEEWTALLRSSNEILTIDEGEEEKFRRQGAPTFRGSRASRSRPRLDEREVAVFSVNRHRLPGVDIHTRLVREYPFGEALAHVVGYVGRNQCRRAEPSRGQSALPGHPPHRQDRRGALVERTLHGYAGLEQVEVDARGRVVRTIDSTDSGSRGGSHPRAGRGLQLRAHAALSGQVGAIRGRRPPATARCSPWRASPLSIRIPWSTESTGRATRRLVGARHRPMFNRALHGQYSPGSVAKIFLAFAGLDQSLEPRARPRLVRRELPSPGHHLRVPATGRPAGTGGSASSGGSRRAATCTSTSSPTSSGSPASTAISPASWLGQPTGVDLPRESSGPGSVARVEARHPRTALDWPGRRSSPASRQGYVLSTPLQLAERDRHGGRTRGPPAAPGG